MMPEFNAWGELAKFSVAMSTLVGAMSWWRKNSEQDDQVVSETADVVLESLSNADSVNKIEVVTDKNLRDQMSVEEAEELHRERELRGWRWRN